jgi:hypothetical protein
MRKVSVPTLICAVAFSVLGAGICPTAVNSGPCKPGDDGPLPPSCIKRTCSSGLVNAQSCAAPYTNTKLCLASSGTWSCSYLIYPVIYVTNKIADNCNDCTGDGKFCGSDGKCYEYHATGCDMRFPNKYDCAAPNHPCSGTCEYDVQDLVDSPLCQAPE